MLVLSYTRKLIDMFTCKYTYSFSNPSYCALDTSCFSLSPIPKNNISVPKSHLQTVTIFFLSKSANDPQTSDKFMTQLLLYCAVGPLKF